MNRLASELQRLYPAPDGASVRTMVLELAGPSPWEQLSQAWQGVQADLDLPAPAIAVNGRDAYQLWFSLAEPLPAGQAAQFMASLRTKYLPEAKPERVATIPPDTPARRLPPFEVSPGRWSAFVTPDLATLFADEPSLDMPPGDDAQAELLSRVQAIRAADMQRALQQLAAAASAPPAPTQQDPRRFLLSVMNDPAVDLRLRIEAAKALLPSTSR